MKAGFEAAAREALGDSQLRRNMARATATIRARRADAVEEVGDWEELREAGAAIKAAAMADLPGQLQRLERAVEERGGQVHWARDAAEANAIVAALARAHGAEELLKVKSIATEEIELNDALAAAGVTAHETDFAELVNQLSGDWSSHILVPAIHRNRSEIRLLFEETIARGRRLEDDPEALAAVAREHLRELGGSVRQPGRCRPPDSTHLVDEDVADLGPVAVDGRDEDVRRQVVAELDDHLGEVGLPDVDTFLAERLVELHLLRRHRLDLDDLRRAVLLDDRGDDRVRLGCVARPMNRAAGCRHAFLESVKEGGQVAHDLVLDGGPGEPQLLPVLDLGHRA